MKPATTSIFAALAGLTIVCSGLLWGAALIDEPFDYELNPDLSEPNIGGKAGGTGWTGAWAHQWGPAKVFDGGLAWGSLKTTGRRVKAPGHNAIYRPIGATLADAGLLDNGATLWFSFVADLRDQGIITNLEFHVALATDSFLAGWGGDANGNERYTRMHHLLNNGEGIGISAQPMNRSGTMHAQFRTAFWQDNGENDNDAKDGPDGYGNLHKSGDNLWFGITQETALVVAKIEWGADAGAGETITLYLPGENFWTPGGGYDLGEAIQTETTVALDQSLFDTVSIMWKDTPGLDEIRFGATMEDVLPIVANVRPEITSFRSLGGGDWELTLKGAANTAYEFRSSTTLDFNPGTLVENLTQGDAGDPGATGGTNNSMLFTDGNGDGTVRLALTGNPADFVRAQTAPPLLGENFDAAATLPAGWASTVVSGTDTAWGFGPPTGAVTGPAEASSLPNCAGTNISGDYTASVDVRLTSPSILIPAGLGATLSFRQFIDTDLAGDVGSVRILDADNSDTPIAGLEIANIEGDGAAGWTSETLDLPAVDVGGKNIRIEFQFTSNGNGDVYSGFYVDDVTVTVP
ncbi:MAG: immune inhibitor A [Akkermansiaceae bacterium]|nr:immune inhibitor A [Akkermansiaceae bacterium]